MNKNEIEKSIFNEKYTFETFVSGESNKIALGTALKIAPKTVQKMKSDPNDIIALIGPCISFDYFETYDEALIQLKNSVQNKEGLFKDNYADLKGINKRQLEEIGVKTFDIIPFCTVKDNDKFFSYRKENQTKLRHSALVKL